MLFAEGTPVRVVQDVRPDELATGKIATYVGDADEEGWLLFTADGKMERTSYTLPSGYEVWDHETQPWPKKPCGIRCVNPIFKLEDGTVITGAECYWEPVDIELHQDVREAQENIMQKLNEEPS